MRGYTNLDELKSRAEILETAQQLLPGVSFKKSGGNYFAKCPFHKEKTGSFSVSTDRQTFHCFGCGIGGDVIKLVELAEGLPFRDAVKYLCDLTGTPFRQSPLEQARSERKKGLLGLHADAAEYYQKRLFDTRGDDAQQAREYILDRIDEASIRKWGLGLASGSGLYVYLREGYSQEMLLSSGLAFRSSQDEGIIDFFRYRIMIPLLDGQGKVIGFAGRALTDKEKPKYINSPETGLFSKSKFLYGLNFAKHAIRIEESVVVTEGYFDVINAHEQGIENCVATGGTSFTNQQIRMLSPMAKEIVMCYDADEAGVKATIAAGRLGLEEDVLVTVMDLEEGDPADVLKDEEGAEVFRGRYEQRQDFFSFLLDQKGIRALEGPDKKYKAAKSLFGFIACSKSPLRQTLWLKALSDELGLDHSEVVQGYTNHLEKQRNHKIGLGAQSIEELVLAFLTVNPTHRLEARELFERENFSRPEYQMYFEFLTQAEESDEALFSSWTSVSEHTLFTKPEATDLIEAFKRFCEKNFYEIHEAQLNSLEGMLMRNLHNQPEVLAIMRAEILKDELEELGEEIRRAMKEEYAQLNSLLQEYHSKQQEHNALCTGN